MKTTVAGLRSRRLPAGALTLVLVLLIAGFGVAPRAAAASAAPATAAVPAALATTAPDPALLGSAADQAAGSCWEIKQQRPSAPSGAYWLLTPSMAEPQRFYCDQTTDGGGWVLVGKGRNGWTMDDAGTGSATALLNPAYAGGEDTHQHTAQLVNQLLDGARVVDLAEGVRVRRALSSSGSQWQEVRFRPDTRQTGWSWAFGARFNVGSWSFTPDSSSSSSTSSGSGGLTDYFGTGSSWSRVRTIPAAVTAWTHGFAYGDSVTGSSSSSTYLWASTNGGARAIPVAQVYLRPRVSSGDADFRSLPDSGTAEIERRALPSSDADVLPWGVAGVAGSTSREGSVEVQELLEAHGRMYVGGNFRYVQRDASGTGRVEQPFLAAFDLDTGEWVSSFRPTLNEQVRALELSSTGAIIAGGDFTSANGAPASAIVALDPDTGATDTSFKLTVENRLSGGVLRVWALERIADTLYLGGEFTHFRGGSAIGFTYMRALGRVRITDGQTLAGWNPEMNGSVIALDASDDGTRIYAAGHFTSSRGIATRRAAAVLTTFVTNPDGTIQHLATPAWTPVWSSSTDYQQAIVEAGGNVWAGGAEHSIFGFDRGTFQRNSTTILHSKGDVQTFSVAGDVLFAGSHANNQYAYSGATTWSGSGAGGPWTAAYTQHWIGAYDATTGQALADFAPNISMRIGQGIWGSTVDSRGRLWVGGDIRSVRTVWGGRFSGGFARYSPRDAAAPATPQGFRVVSVNDTSVSLAWDGGSDPSGVRYQVLRDDRPVGVTSQAQITLPVDVVAGEIERFFVRAADGARNVSASTPVLEVTIPSNQPPSPAFTVASDRLTISVDAAGSTDPDGTISDYDWDFGDGSSGTGRLAGHTYAAPGTYLVTLTVTDDEGLTASTSASVEVDRTAPVNLVADDSDWTWRYQSGAPEAGWTTVAFNDAAWQHGGQAPLGWAPASATQPATGIDTFGSPSQRPLAAYFRQTFQVANPGQLQEIVVTGVADDGTVFYVNGVEIGRQNMPAGTVTYQTFASTSRRLSVAAANPVVLQVPAALLVAGTNVVAAETHLNYKATPDLTFYLSLDALAP